jgi:hypothetical protein
MKKRRRCDHQQLGKYTLTIDIGKEGKKGVVDDGGLTRRVLTQTFH